ncbi:hypothetical protein BJV82DRAFT_689102 [Fennellomyces sp. T-0311]|nr:hypothetical protein BJV82DRAFT_689102 [Fennellomyces sp. T-0311]
MFAIIILPSSITIAGVFVAVFIVAVVVPILNAILAVLITLLFHVVVVVFFAFHATAVIVLIAKYLAFPLLYHLYRRLIPLVANPFKKPSRPSQLVYYYGTELNAITGTSASPLSPFHAQPARSRTRPQTWCYDIVAELDALEDASSYSYALL